MARTFLLDIDDKEIKNLLRQLLDENYAREIDFIEFLFAEIDEYDNKIPVNIHLLLNKIIKKEILIFINSFICDKIGRKVKFCLQFNDKIEKNFKLVEYWSFFCDEMENLKAWLQNTTPVIEDNTVIIRCDNSFIFAKLNDLRTINKIRQKIKEFFNIETEIQIIENKDKPAISNIVNQKIEISFSEESKKSKILTDEIIKGNIKEIEEIEKEGIYIVEGRIFYNSKNLIKEIRREKQQITFYMISFYITNEKDTIKIIAFLDEGDALLKKIENIKYARLSINVKYSENDREFVGYLKKMNQLPEPEIIDDCDEKRIELHAHTTLSAMDSVLSIKDYIDTAISCGHKAIAITDHGVVHSFPVAYNYLKGKNLKLIFGLEGYLVESEERSKENTMFHIIILVRNYTGLKNLYKIVSYSHLNHFYRKPRILKKELLELREGLLLGTACNQGELFKAILEKKPEAKIAEIVSFYDYLEIQPNCNNFFLIEKKIISSENELKEINKKIYELGRKFNKPVVATGDIHFLRPKDKIYREILLYGQGYDDFLQDGSADLSFKTTTWMLNEFSYLGQQECMEVVVKNPDLISGMIEDNIMPVPNKPCPPQIKGADDEIREKTWTNARNKYGKNIHELIVQRIKKELDAITSHNYATLYYLAWKMVEQSVKDGYIVGSRGSVGSSLVAYLCGITEVNPLPAHYFCSKCKYIEFVVTDMVGVDLSDKKCPGCGTDLGKDGYNIPFETFMGFKGEKMPDIDLNFSGEYQDEIHKFVIDFFGKDKVFRAGTIVTMQEQAIKKDFINKYLEKTKRVLKKSEIERLAKGCAGTKRSTGQHAGGLMLVPSEKEIYDFTPIQFSPQKDQITTHFEYENIHETLVKVDALGHDLPTSLKRICSELNINVEQIPLNDKKTMKLFSDIKVIGVKSKNYPHSVGVLGIPEYGTKLTRDILEFTKPKTFSELIYISGISHGTNVWTNNAYDLIKSKKATLTQVISVRDDIMNFLISKGLPSDKAFNIMENVRRGNGLTRQDEELMRKKGVPDWYIISCKKIKYLFPKAHATAYAIMSFRMAYIKVHYPLYFYADYFTREIKGFEYEFINLNFNEIKKILQSFKMKYNFEKKEEEQLKVLEVLLEAKERGIEFLNVDLYESESQRFKVKNNKILAPLILVPELGEKIAESIVRERNCGRFSSIEDLLKRTKPKPNKNSIQFMIRNKILDMLPETDQAILF